MEISKLPPLDAPLHGESVFGPKRETPDVEGRSDPIGESGSGSSASSEVRSVERGGAASGGELNEEEQREVAEFERRDLEVQQHERAHRNAAGSLAQGGVSYEYAVGPDGKRYAVGGEVQIDVSKEPGDPDATIRKARQIRRAALAPKQPSGADRAIAARASRMEAEARREMSRAEIDGIEEEGSVVGEESGASVAADPTTEGPAVGEAVPAGPAPVIPSADEPDPGSNEEPGAHIDLFA